MASSIPLLVFVVVFFLPRSAESQGGTPPLVPGLSWNFYDSSCPQLESIVRSEIRRAFRRDVGVAAGVLRLHFHDCFVQGCEASVLLDGSASGPDETDAPPNLTLRPSAFQAIDAVRRRVNQQCGTGVVSCSDLLALAARDTVVLSGGPDYDIPLGRRDSLDFATVNETLRNLPPPFFNSSQLVTFFDARNFTATDMVALSGGHTVGIANCGSFTPRLYPTQDPTLGQTFANNLRLTCPAANATNTTVLDIRSPNVFDNRYFVNLMNRQGLLTSDQDLYEDRRTRDIVTSFAINQTLFFEAFVVGMIKMSQMRVLTGTAGEIRANCSARNSGGAFLSSMAGADKNAWSAV
ncbi:peroxidase 12 [Andrographis paniculata]|uniref:peroxidase 12 n=1 Tax=Andrographis paniculata TaxID=175694 RepID=UPI0021E75E0C|nr:peroxidase 12 [Andrographis paniculata]